MTVRDTNNKPDSYNNRFVLSDGTDFDDTDYLYQWVDDKPGYTNYERCNFNEFFEFERSNLGF